MEDISRLLQKSEMAAATADAVCTALSEARAKIRAEMASEIAKIASELREEFRGQLEAHGTARQRDVIMGAGISSKELQEVESKLEQGMEQLQKQLK